MHLAFALLAQLFSALRLKRSVTAKRRMSVQTICLWQASLHSLIVCPFAWLNSCEN